MAAYRQADALARLSHSASRRAIFLTQERYYNEASLANIYLLSPDECLRRAAVLGAARRSRRTSASHD